MRITVFAGSSERSAEPHREAARALGTEIARRGHEMASHGYSHRRVAELTPDEFRHEIRTTKRILEDLVGARFVHVIEGGEGKAPLAVPDGWTLESVALEEDWVLPLPNPTTVFFFRNGDSFQGPIEVPSPAGATSESA